MPAASKLSRLDDDHAVRFARGLWALADPKISLASFASIFLGACAAAAVAPIDWGWLAATVLGIFAIEIAKNASGEIFDFDSGVDQAVTVDDRTPFSGGKRVPIDGLLTRGETWAISFACYLIGTVLGIWIAAERAPAILGIGIAGLLLAYQYHAPPLKLSYRGAGELAVALCYGPLIATGTYLVQTQDAPLGTALAATPLGLLIAGFLVINEFPDYAADKTANKKTLVVQLGRARAVRLFTSIEVYAFAFLAALPFFGASLGVLGGMIGLPVALAAAFQLMRNSETGPEFINIQKKTLLAFLLTAVGEGLGLLIASHSLF
jgi:1,4-dihydroxy-2-naphthoate octaprenyltransferase